MSQWRAQITEGANTCWQFVRHLTRRFFRDGCQESAAALTYMTLFALVPMLTLIFAMFSLVPAFQGMEERLQVLIFANFLPETSSDIQQYLEGFMGKARNLGWVGFCVLIVTAYLMLINIEKTFNKIWGTAGGRKGLSSFLLYWAILSLGPILVGIALLIDAYGLVNQFLQGEGDILGIGSTLQSILPFVFAWAAATLLFVAVPNCKVRVRYALAGGLITVLLFEGLKSGFGWIVANSSYQTVYGTFAVVPLFLLWIYLIWTLVLLGAELVRALETFKTSVRGYGYPNLVVALMILSEASQQQQRGQTISDRHMLLAGVDQHHWQQLRDLFLERQILVSTANGRYVLSRDLAKMPLSEIVGMFGEHFATDPSAGAWGVLERYPWSHELKKLLDDFRHHAEPMMATTVAELLTDDR